MLLLGGGGEGGECIGDGGLGDYAWWWGVGAFGSWGMCCGRMGEFGVRRFLGMTSIGCVEEDGSL